MRKARWERYCDRCGLLPGKPERRVLFLLLCLAALWVGPVLSLGLLNYMRTEDYPLGSTPARTQNDARLARWGIRREAQDLGCQAAFVRKLGAYTVDYAKDRPFEYQNDLLGHHRRQSLRFSLNGEKAQGLLELSWKKDGWTEPWTVEKAELKIGPETIDLLTWDGDPPAEQP